MDPYQVQVTSSPTGPSGTEHLGSPSPTSSKASSKRNSISRNLSSIRSSSRSRKSGNGNIRPDIRSRWNLHLQATFWRILEQIGTWLSQLPKPLPPQPSFFRQFSAHVVGEEEAASIELAFYVPEDYATQIRKGKRYPIVVNLHGGGFTLGTAKDDARWAAYVLAETHAIFVSVEYRLAPEYPFPTGVEDGVEALLHLASQAEQYGIDPHRMALSGFSAGGNMAFTIPLRLQTHLQSIRNEVASKSPNALASSEHILPRIASIIAWYPSLDQRLTRAERRAACSRPEKTLPPILTDLFDEAWLPEVGSKDSPFASPAAATDEALRIALPHTIAMYLCEWDMLLQEGQDFYERLKGLGKGVRCSVIKEKRHAFDKSPYPFSVDPKVGEYYGEACGVLNEAFGEPGREGSGQIEVEGEGFESRVFTSEA